MTKFLRHGSSLAALGVAVGAGYWLGCARPRGTDGGTLPDRVFGTLFSRVSAAALQGSTVRAPVDLPRLEPGAPRVTQVRML